MLGSLLVDVGRGLMAVLVDLVTKSILGSRGTLEKWLASGSTEYRKSIEECLPSAERGLAVLGDLLVGLLRGGRRGLLDGIPDVVGGVLDRLHCD